MMNTVEMSYRRKQWGNSKGNKLGHYVENNNKTYRMIEDRQSHKKYDGSIVYNLNNKRETEKKVDGSNIGSDWSEEVKGKTLGK